MQKAIVKEIRYLTNLIRRELDESELFKNNPDLTNVKGWTMGYIYRMQKKGLAVYQKDIEREFKIGRSTATELLQSLEQNEFLKREACDTDGRLKKIILLEKGIKLQKEVIKTLETIENKVLAGFTNEDKHNLFNSLERIRMNLEGKDNKC